jgi:hypothetical protein
LESFAVPPAALWFETREDALLVLARPVIVGAFRKERPTPGGRPEWVAGRRIERS